MRLVFVEFAFGQVPDTAAEDQEHFDALPRVTHNVAATGSDRFRRLIGCAVPCFRNDYLDPVDRERLVGTVRDMGFYGLDIPPEYGGPDIDIVTRTLMAIEMSQHRAGLYVPCYGVFGGAGLAQLFEANEDQKERYLFPTLRGEKHGFFGLTEPSGGSDPARAIRTSAVRDGDDWVVNGAKIFISGADRADYGIIFARTDAAKGPAMMEWADDRAREGYESPLAAEWLGWWA